MSLQELSVKQINEALALAAQKTIPITITYRQEPSWVNLTSRMVRIADNRLLVELPPIEADVAPHEFVPAEKIGISFKLKHHKHIFTATVAGVQDHVFDDGEPMKVLGLCMPMRMQRLQRRMFYRADVPPNRIVRASFWMGGRDGEPSGTSAATPVWTGRVTNLSAGGLQLIAAESPLPSLEIGDSVGVRLSFGSGQEAVYADAQFRHLVQEGQESVVGLQFIALGQSAEGRDTRRRAITPVAATSRYRAESRDCRLC